MALAMLLTTVVAAFVLSDALASMVDEVPMDEPPGGRRMRKARKYAPSRIPGRSVRPGGIGEAVFKPHVDALDAFFRPMVGNVLSASGSLVRADMHSGSGVMPGMRFSVMRQGEPFVHPVTAERVTGSETPVGFASVHSVNDSSTLLGIVNGQAAPGDVLRVSSAPVQVLYYQNPSVDWDVSEEYYYWLTANERFQVVDAPVGRVSEEALVAIARSGGADILVMLEGAPLPEPAEISNSTVLDGVPAVAAKPTEAVRQRVLWSSDGSELYTSQMVVGEDLLKRLKVAGEMFWPDSGKPSLVVEVPFRADLIHMADINCDGIEEVVLGTGSRLYFYNVDIALRPPFGLEEPLVLKGDRSYANVWLDSLDHDGDGCDEIMVTSLRAGREPLSLLYKYSDGKFDLLWQDKVFARVVDNALYAQHPSKRGGYAGEIFQVDIASSASPESTLALPSGVDIYEFMFFNSPDAGDSYILAYDKLSYMALYNGAGEMLWRSEGSYGGQLKTFGASNRDDMLDEEVSMIWAVNDRLRVRAGDVYAIYRAPRLESMPGFGYRGSGIIRLFNPGTALGEEVYVRDITGAASDFIFSGDRLYVLRDSGSFRLLNMFRGRQIFTSRILVYSTEGR